VEIEQLDVERMEEWSDGSRADGRAAGATRTRVLYLGEWASVADAEEVGCYWLGKTTTGWHWTVKE